jgi:non-homologous end joining protein Ku
VSNEAFCVIRDAIRDKGMAGIARIVLARRERMILLEPLDEGLVQRCTQRTRFATKTRSSMRSKR